MSTWGGLRSCTPTAEASAGPAPSGSPRGLDHPVSDHPDRPGAHGELGSLPPQIGKPALRWRSELPPRTGRRLCGAARGPPSASRARPAAAPAATISPGPQADARGPRRPPGKPGSLAQRLRRHRQTAGSCARRTARYSRGTRRARNVHAVPGLLRSLVAWAGEAPATEAARARDGAPRRLARSVRRRRRRRGPFRGAGGGSGGAG